MVLNDGENLKGLQKSAFKAERFAKWSYIGMKPTALAERKSRSNAQILPDDEAVNEGYLRIVDESGDEKERRKKYREFVRGRLKERKSMEGEMGRRIIYGREGFMKRITKEYDVWGSGEAKRELQERRR